MRMKRSAVKPTMRYTTIFCCLALLAAFAALSGEDTTAKTLAALDSNVLTTEERARWKNLLDEDSYARLRELERADSRAWAAVKTKEDWERFRDARIQKLRESMNLLPPG